MAQDQFGVTDVRRLAVAAENRMCHAPGMVPGLRQARPEAPFGDGGSIVPPARLEGDLDGVNRELRAEGDRANRIWQEKGKQDGGEAAHAVADGDDLPAGLTGRKGINERWVDRIIPERGAFTHKSHMAPLRLSRQAAGKLVDLDAAELCLDACAGKDRLMAEWISRRDR